MSSTVVTAPVRLSVPGWHEQFLAFILPAVETVARHRFHGLPEVEREEGLAEATATAMITFLRLIRRGKAPATFAGRLAEIAVLQVLAGRVSGSPDNCQDAMSRLGRQRHGIRVESLDGGSLRSQAGWDSVLVENHRVTPADLAAARIDFAEWLGRMQRRRREIAETLAAGYRTDEVAQKFQLTKGRVPQLVASYQLERSGGPAWSELPARGRRRLRNQIKKWLNTEAVSRMTPGRLADRDPDGEVRSWLAAVSRLPDQDPHQLHEDIARFPQKVTDAATRM